MQTLENQTPFAALPETARAFSPAAAVHQADADLDDNDFRVPAWKRTFDVCVILLSVPLWLPVMAVISFWIFLVSPGPIFFTQSRIGLRGKQFKIYKFRSMKVHADTSTHVEHFAQLVDSDRPMTKLDAAGDRRMIFSGRFLRATGLDELPQLFNVLKGEMSLVGPRPCTEPELSKYRLEQLERFDACPGLTGYWQVNGKNRTTFSRMIDLDIHYARHASLRLDLSILAKTLPALLAQVRETKAGSDLSVQN